MTLRQAVCAARDRLAANPYLAPSAAQDAELLLLHALSLPRTTIYAYPGRLLNQREQAAYAAVIDRRLLLEPIQYITGRQEFYGLPLDVSPHVLIPRPETELLVEAVLDRLPQDRALRLADVGTGSGAIAISLAVHLPRSTIVATDLSPGALAVASANAAKHVVTDRIDFVLGDLLATLPSDIPRFDAICSNPPYIPEADRSSLHPQVRDWEPSAALFAGARGLDLYRRLIPMAWRHLAPAGLLALEFGAGQHLAMQDLLRDWRAVQLLNDLQGIPRVALARRS